MSETKTKKLVLKRCYFQGSYTGNAEDLLMSINNYLPKQEDRKISDGDFFRDCLLTDICPASRESNKGVYATIIVHEKGPTGIVSFDDAHDAQVKEHHPPSNSEFLCREIHLLVVENCIIVCGLSGSDGVIENILTRLGGKTDSDVSDTIISVDDVPNHNELERIVKVGVKSISLDVTSYLANLDGVLTPEQNGISRLFGMMFARSDSKLGVQKRANAKGKIFLNRGRVVKSEEKKDAWLTGIGQTIVDSNMDGYTLVLEDGTKLSSFALKVSKDVKLKKFVNTISTDHARRELKAFYEKLKSDGVLDW